MSHRFSTKRYFSDVGLNYYGYRFYAPSIGRWMNRDPLGEAGGLNLYGFVQNNPINAIDPWGLDTAVAVGGPTSGNPFGHVAISFTGQGVYSYGTSTPLGSSFTEYLAKQATYRYTVVYILKTTPKQEALMKEEILKYRGKPLPDPRKDLKGAAKDTCATRTQSALEAGDITSIFIPYKSPFPGDMGYIALHNGANTLMVPKGSDIPSSLLPFNK